MMFVTCLTVIVFNLILSSHCVLQSNNDIQEDSAEESMPVLQPDMETSKFQQVLDHFNPSDTRKWNQVNKIRV